MTKFLLFLAVVFVCSMILGATVSELQHQWRLRKHENLFDCMKEDGEDD